MASIENQWVVFKLAGNLYAISTRFVREMTLKSHVNEIPNTPDYIMGAMRLRGQVLPIMDLRVRLGVPSLSQEKNELVEMLRAREKDHVNWLQELEDCVSEERPFHLARDPHQCAFGKWYDRFTTTDRILGGQLRKLDQPHRAIHAVADEALDLLASGDPGAAKTVIDRTRDRELALMIKLFGLTRAMIEERNLQIIIILEFGDKLFGMAVDEILSVSRFLPEQIRNASMESYLIGNSYMLGVAQFEHSGKGLVIMLNAGKIIGPEMDIE